MPSESILVLSVFLGMTQDVSIHFCIMLGILKNHNIWRLICTGNSTDNALAWDLLRGFQRSSRVKNTQSSRYPELPTSPVCSLSSHSLHNCVPGQWPHAAPGSQGQSELDFYCVFWPWHEELDHSKEMEHSGLP